MRLAILGTAAGGGLPQWNCACQVCDSCRAGRLPARRQDCLAFSGDGSSWTLLNASPDIRAQLLDSSALRPGPGPRDTPLRGVLLTDAELDHMLGLLLLREGDGMPVWGPNAAVTAASERFGEVLGGYGDWTFAPPPDKIDGIEVRVLPVSHKRPKYARDSAADGDWVVAYRLTDPAGGSVVYAPCLAHWPEGFDEFIHGADYALLDGTFSSAEEMGGTGVSHSAQRAMGHVPILGEGGSLRRRARHSGTRWIYTHLNNTNPLNDPRSRQARAVREAGAEVLADGTELRL